jgi:hypothetical protein
LRDEDYDVLAYGTVVGRIYEDASASTPPELRWRRSITAIVPATPGVTNGATATLDEAKASLGRCGRSRRWADSAAAQCTCLAAEGR